MSCGRRAFILYIGITNGIFFEERKLLIINGMKK